MKFLYSVLGVEYSDTRQDVLHNTETFIEESLKLGRCDWRAMLGCGYVGWVGSRFNGPR